MRYQKKRGCGGHIISQHTWRTMDTSVIKSHNYLTIEVPNKRNTNTIQSMPARPVSRKCSAVRRDSSNENTSSNPLPGKLRYNAEEILKTSAPRSALVCDITQRRVEISYRRFGTTYWSLTQGTRNPERKSDRPSRKVGKRLPLQAGNNPEGFLGHPVAQGVSRLRLTMETRVLS